jgi:hypothetical protein
MKDGAKGIGNKTSVALVNLLLFYGVCIVLSKATKKPYYKSVLNASLCTDL